MPQVERNEKDETYGCSAHVLGTGTTAMPVSPAHTALSKRSRGARRVELKPSHPRLQWL